MFDLPATESTATEAPGRPGASPTWSGGAKDMVGCALGPSRIWFTLGQGIVNEVYYPRADIPQIRDLGFIVADDAGFWAEVRRLGSYRVTVVEPGVPAVEAIHRHERFTLRLRVVPDPKRDALLLEVDLQGDPDLRVYALLAPRLGATGANNRAWAGVHRGRRVLWAEQGPFALALLASAAGARDAFMRTSAGYAGVSDGWQDFAANGAMTWCYGRAGPGSVALMGELPPSARLALGLATSKESAATLAATALEQSFEDALARLTQDWRSWHARCEGQGPVSAALPESLQAPFVTSATVLRTHLDRTFPGAMVASLSIPWGTSRGERPGYHLVRVRDLCEGATALLALGAIEEARDILRYLIATQDPDGHWPGGQWLGGKPAPGASRPADAAYPVMLAAALSERGALESTEAQAMVERALGCLIARVQAGVTGAREPRGRADAASIGTGVAGLVAGARFLGQRARGFVLAVADYWNAMLEPWTLVQGSALCRNLGVSSYYRCAAPGGDGERDTVGAEFLALVRLGLRRPDDPAILDSLRVLDSLLKVRTPSGPAWRRHLGDGYGEHADGRPFDGGGRGHPWPLLTGERGHYELAAGRDPLPYLEAMAAMASESGLLPEQVWDGPPLAEHGLLPGRPTGSAMPLAWAHAEFVKLALSRALGRPLDRSVAVWRRYQARRRQAGAAVWTLQAPIRTVDLGQRLLVACPRPARLHYGRNRWRATADALTSPTPLGLHVAELPTEGLATGDTLELTLQWQDSGEWLGQDYTVRVRAPEPVGDPPGQG
jgi:glucoamylase